MLDFKNKPILFVIVAFLLLLSGASSLIYEVVWSRILFYTFGNTEMAAATVWATFMGGMALGGALGAKYASKLKRPIMVYGILEAIIAIFGLIVTPFLYKLDFIYTITGSDPSVFLLVSMRFLMGALVMLIPTVAMGATLPVLVHGLVSRTNAGKGVSLLYFINITGAVAGTILAGFYLIPKIGLDKAVWVAVIVGLIVSTVSILIQFKMKPIPEEDKITSKEDKKQQKLKAGYSPWVLKYSYIAAMVFAFFAGFISLSNEVLWFKLLGILLDGTIYGYSALLAAFLTGLALGSLWISNKIDKTKDLWGLYAKLQIGAALGAVATILLIPIIPFLISGYIAGGTKAPGTVFFVKVVMVFFTILIPTFFYGASFPILARIAGLEKKMSSALGEVYSINTVGCIIGSAGMGMVLMPFVKNINMLLLAMVFLSIIVAFGASLFSGGADKSKAVSSKIKLLSAVGASLLLVILLNPNVNVVRIVNSRYSIEDYGQSIGSRVKSLFGSTKDRKNLVFEVEGAVTVVTVHKFADGGFRLRNNGLNESYHAVTQPYYADEIFFLGALPYILHPNAEKALLIGLGGGGTLDIMTQSKLKKIEVAELEPEVVKASRLMFGGRKHPVDLKRVRLRLDDGRNALLRHAKASPHTYDLVVSQPSHPWLSGAANLYTVEHFNIVKKNLKKNGMLCQWLNLFRMNEKGFKSLMAAFTKSFDNGYVFQVDDNSVFLIGINGDYKLSSNTIEKHLKEKTFVELAKHYNLSVNRILRMYFYDYNTAKTLAKGVVTNSDHTPIIETVLPWVGHNTMYSVEKLLLKKGLKYGINPTVLNPTDPTGMKIRKYLDYLIDDIDVHGDEVSNLKYKRKFFTQTMKNWKSELGDDYYRIQARFHVRSLDFVSALNFMKNVKNRSEDDLRKLSVYNEKAGNPIKALKIRWNLIHMRESSLTYIGVELHNLLGWFKIDHKMSDVTFSSGDITASLNILEKLNLPKLFINILSKVLLSDPKLKSRTDLLTWYYVAGDSVGKRTPNKEYLEKYIELGGDNPDLVKEMLIVFSANKGRYMIDNLISAVQSWSSLDPELFGIAKRLIELDLTAQAMVYFEKLYKSQDNSIESKEIVKEILNLKIKTNKMDGVGRWYKEFNKLAYDNDGKEFSKKILKKFDKKGQELLKNNKDPDISSLISTLNKD
jgi:spermidine synthase